VDRQVNNPANDVANFPRITQSETSLARFNDFILYGFNDSNDFTGGPGGKHSYSGFAFSSDLGRHWTDGGSIPINPGGTNGGDPSITVDRNGVFYYGQVGSEVVGGVEQGVISISTGTVNPDNTITMNPPQIVGKGQNPVGTRSGAQDKEWITVGPDANNPGNEALYVAWSDLTVGPSPDIRFSKFKTGVNLTPIIQNQTIVLGNTNFLIGTFVVVDNLGTIYVFYEQILAGQINTLGQPNRSIRMTKSTDGGTTFPINVPITTPFEAAASSISPCSRPSIGVTNVQQIRLFELPQAAIGPDGTLYVVWNAGRVVGTRTSIDIFLAYSQDEGNTWNTVKITNTLSFSFLPSVAADSNGAHIQYNRFSDPSGVGGVGDGLFGVFMKTFSPYNGLSNEKMVSTEFSPVSVTNPNPDPVPPRCYMGDYNQIITGPGNTLLHAWSDNRNVLNGKLNPDVFFNITEPCI
jgi:hypothetical protein